MRTVPTIAAALLLCGVTVLQAQKGEAEQTQTVDSRKGYVARIPAEAKLDSSMSGWSAAGLFERRVYRIRGVGEIRFTVTVKPTTIPEGATKTTAYTFTERDSATAGGTAFIRTYYLPTRTVRIELIPSGVKMKKYIDGREAIFSSFRWKPGATTDVIDTDPPIHEPPPVPTQSGIGG